MGELVVQAEPVDMVAEAATAALSTITRIHTVDRATCVILPKEQSVGPFSIRTTPTKDRATSSASSAQTGAIIRRLDENGQTRSP